MVEAITTVRETVSHLFCLTRKSTLLTVPLSCPEKQVPGIIMMEDDDGGGDTVNQYVMLYCLLAASHSKYLPVRDGSGFRILLYKSQASASAPMA